jgi:fatty-acyl-CoA synthase
VRALGSEEQRATDHHLLGALIEAPSDRVVRFVGAGGMESTWQERAQLARRVAGQLRRHGIQRGEAVGLLLTNGPSCVNALVGTWAAGATVMSLPLPSRTQDRPQYAETIARLCDTAGATTVIVERAVSSLLEDVDRERFRVLVADELSDGAPVDPDPLDAGEVAFIQCSSGSTGNALTFAALSRQLDLLDGMVEMDPRSDIVVSWLPLSHDMGLIGGLLLQWSRGTRLVLGSPERFLSAPRTWMGDCADAGATITVGPSAALRLAARHARRR